MFVLLSGSTRPDRSHRACRHAGAPSPGFVVCLRGETRQDILCQGGPRGICCPGDGKARRAVVTKLRCPTDQVRGSQAHAGIGRGSFGSPAFG